VNVTVQESTSKASDRHTIDYTNLEAVDRQFEELLMRRKTGNLRGRVSVNDDETSEKDNERFWKETVLPHWPTLYRTQIVERFWSREGLPLSVRGRVWAKCIGNPVGLNKNSYVEFKNQHDVNCQFEWVGDIERMFKGRNCSTVIVQDMKEVLNAFYNFYRGQFTYIQPISYLVRMLVAWMEPAQAWFSLSNMVQIGFMDAWLRMDVAGMRDRFAVFQIIMDNNAPYITTRLKEMSIPPDCFLQDWVFSMFVKALPFALVCRMWDNFFLFGEIFIWKACVGLLIWLARYENLISLDINKALYTLRCVPPPQASQYGQLMELISCVKVPTHLLKKFRCDRRIDDARAHRRPITPPQGSDDRKDFKFKRCPTNPIKPSPDIAVDLDPSELRLSHNCSGFYDLDGTRYAFD